jgi:hypothetical protein
VDDGSISMNRDGQIETRCPTSYLIGKLDGIQTELLEGPCITAIDDAPSDGTVLARDFAGEDAHRWPRFAPHAVEAGYRTLMSIQLDINGGARAALNLYSATPDAYDDAARTLAGLFGIEAALLLYGAQTADHLTRAVNSRDVIGQAKGILRERFRITDGDAFQMLVKSSQETNMKLNVVAQWLVDDADTSGSTPVDRAR